MIELFKYAILAGAVGATMFSKRWGLAAFAFFLPLTQWFPEIPVPGLNALNLMLLPILLRAARAGRATGVASGEPLALPLSLMFVAWTISWLRVQWSDFLPIEFLDEGGLYGNFVNYKEFIVDLLMYYCARRLTRDDDSMRRVTIGIVGGFMFEGLTSAQEFIVGRASRATAHLGQPNKLGDFLAAYVMLPLAWSLDRVRGWTLAGLCGLGFALLGLLGAVSRGALLSMGAAVIACAALRRSPWIVVIAVVIGTAPAWLPEKVMNRFESAIVQGDSGEVEFNTEKEGRFDLWHAGAGMIADHPFLGVGLNMFGSHLREYGYTGRKIKSSHNIYIQLSAEQGLPCALAHVAMLLTILWIAWRVSGIDRGSFASAVGLGMFGATVALMVSTCFGDGFYENNLTGPYWLGAGALVSLWKREVFKRDASPRETHR